MQGSKLKDYLHLHVIVFIWGFTAILGRKISIDAIPLVWYRMLLASVLIILYLLIRKKKLELDRTSLFKFFLTGTIIALHWITFFKAIKVSNVSVALVTMSTGAFFTSLIEPIFFKRRIRAIEILLGAMVVGGLYIIFSFESQYTWGIIYALISSFLSALFAVLNGLFVKKHPADVISFYQLFFGVVFISIFLAFTGGFTSEFFNLNSSDWIYLFILGSVCTAYAFIASIHVMRNLTPYTVMLTINLEPVYAIILALIIFGEDEKMNPQFYLGALIILFVVLLNGVLKNRKRFRKEAVENPR
jgi:drug/metabolite transporter (DMT)-like permease